MDSITHAVLGACVGEALGGKKLGKKAMLWGAIANNIPDIDVLSSLWMTPPGSLLAHRGFTHSILFVLLMTPVAGWFMKKLYAKNSFSNREWSMLFGINMMLHILIDAFTVYGTGWFEPFSHYRVCFNILFVVDPFYTITLLVATLALLILRRTSQKRFAWTLSGILISSLYLVYATYHKIKVDVITKHSLENNSILYSDFMATPTPLNNFLWYVVAANDSGYHIGYYSVFDSRKDITFHFIARNEVLIRDQENSETVKKLTRFSKGYYHIENVNDTLVFNDLRFGQMGGWSSGNAPFVFQYKLKKNADNKMVIQSGRLRASGGAAFKSMVERIKGN